VSDFRVAAEDQYIYNLNPFLKEVLLSCALFNRTLQHKGFNTVQMYVLSYSMKFTDKDNRIMFSTSGEAPKYRILGNDCLTL